MTNYWRTGTVSWIVLCLGWVLFGFSLWQPGFYWIGNAWSGPRILPGWMALLRTMSSGFDIDHLDDGWFVYAQVFAGFVSTLAAFSFLVSPIYLILRWLYPSASKYWWFAIILPIAWLPPMLAPFDPPNNRYLYGYYGIAIAYSLVFLALVPIFNPHIKKWQGFEPVMKE